MLQLSDQLLIYSYQQARRLKLNNEFIVMLEREIQKRSLKLSRL
ncbi:MULTISPECIES: sporulation histidine kinase inhibitor Sda [Sporosarcina]|nr:MULTISPECIES: sporulation histidine kinase inhibitor Sda [Sporosarcina]